VNIYVFKELIPYRLITIYQSALNYILEDVNFNKLRYKNIVSLTKLAH